MTIDPKSVLIVDDNPNMRAALRTLLREKAHIEQCCEASNGAEAVRRAMEQKPALVLMDLSMPVMNGVEAAAAIKAALPKARIVMFTLYPDRLGPSMAKAVGVDIVIGKHEGSTGLLQAIENFLAGNN